jgi:hypothetical protein
MAPLALPRNITARAITQRPKSIQPAPSSTLKTLASTASRLDHLVPCRGPFFVEHGLCYVMRETYESPEDNKDD